MTPVRNLLLFMVVSGAGYGKEAYNYFSFRPPQQRLSPVKAGRTPEERTAIDRERRYALNMLAQQYYSRGYSPDLVGCTGGMVYDTGTRVPSWSGSEAPLPVSKGTPFRGRDLCPVLP